MIARLLAAGAGSDSCDGWVASPGAGTEYVRLAEDGFAQKLDEVGTGLNRLRGGMCDAALIAGELIGESCVMKGEQRDGGEAHQAAVAGGSRVGGACVGIAGADESGERVAGCEADVEAGAGAAVSAILPPGDEAGGEVVRVEARAADEAVGEGERHRGVVGPLPRFEVEGAAPEHLGMEGLGVAARELQRGA